MIDQNTEQHDDSALESSPRSTTAHVVTVHGSSSGSVREIADRGVSIGRRAEPQRADLAFEDPRMSRLHVRIEQEGVGWKLEDLGSRNGGFVDGIPFQPAMAVSLDEGSVIRMGNTIMVFRAQPPTNQIDGEREVFPGASPPAAEVRRRLALLAATVGHVLILGETGTGKERVARRIGRTHPGRPFIPQNCAEVSRDLVRSELFGHARGAFSGAAMAKEGLVDAAKDGVLFLDEVGELPLDVQGDLLRFLEDGSYRPVGSTELRSSRARVVSATNVDLEAAVRESSFRRDLLARLRASNAPLMLPPLRERREDILGWARRFLDETCASDLPPEIWTAGAAECLVLYPWPENLRELRGVMRALVETAPRWPIGSKLLPERIQAHRRRLRDGRHDCELAAAAPAPAGAAAPAPAAPAEEPTREAIERALAKTEGRMRAASILLGIDRRKLYRMCEKLSINIDVYRSGGS